MGEMGDEKGMMRKIFDHATGGKVEWQQMSDVYDRVVFRTQEEQRNMTAEVMLRMPKKRVSCTPPLLPAARSSSNGLSLVGTDGRGSDCRVLTDFGGDFSQIREQFDMSSGGGIKGMVKFLKSRFPGEEAAIDEYFRLCKTAAQSIKVMSTTPPCDYHAATTRCRSREIHGARALFF